MRIVIDGWGGTQRVTVDPEFGVGPGTGGDHAELDPVGGVYGAGHGIAIGDIGAEKRGYCSDPLVLGVR